jgi:molybdate transport system ATP-binding protein
MIRVDVTKQLHSSLGEFTLRVNEEIREGASVALFGPSGAGKTTLLRMLAGLTMPDDGTIRSGDEVWFDTNRRIYCHPQKRNVGFVFQDYALFPNMTVREHLEFGLAKGISAARVDELLELVELNELQAKKPVTLSGGQQQRVALARALARSPKLLLLDEPLAALDRVTRVKLQDVLLAMQKKLGMTVIIVTHDISEIFRLCTAVIVLKAGTVIQRGVPKDVFGGNTVSGKFKFVGEVLDIVPGDVVSIVSVLIANDINKVVVTNREAKELRTGDKVIVSSKAFNPLISKIS